MVQAPPKPKTHDFVSGARSPRRNDCKAHTAYAGRRTNTTHHHTNVRYSNDCGLVHCPQKCGTVHKP